MWRRDPAVQEMVRALDEYTKRPDWEYLTHAQRLSQLGKLEWQAVCQQQQECTRDFSYAARNYFWITDNSGRDVLMTLWHSQAVILQLYYDLKAMGRPQKVFVLKGRQIGASLLIEAMMLWRTMFFPNTDGIVCSVDQSHSSYLFGWALRIYDRLPWWLKSPHASREEKDGIWFNEPDPERRSIYPGLDSHIYVQWSSQKSGVGQGRKLLAGHISELTDWYQPDARRIITADLRHAIKDTAETFCFIETTGKYVGSYSYNLWRSCERLMEDSYWYPLFLPYFFEPSRRQIVHPGWKPAVPELSMRLRVSKEWVKCDACDRHTMRSKNGMDRAETTCFFCKAGKWKPLVLSDEQLRWKEIERRNAGTDSEALKEHYIEVASTAEESFQIEGLAVFGPGCQDAVNKTIIDPDKAPGIKQGYFDIHQRFHGLNPNRPIFNSGAVEPDTFRCYVPECEYDHLYDREHFNVTIWEEPQQGCAYSIGVDISEGLGQDYSVIFVNKFGRFGAPDEQVAILRDNKMEPLDLAFYCNLLGNYYNGALMCIEYNGIGKVCADAVLYVYNYSNIYRWKHLDSVRNTSNKWHWYTNAGTREKLWQTGRKWIKSGSWIIRSKNFLHEMQMFQKDEDDSKSAGHVDNEHDDELISGLIALYCGHEGEADERGVIRVPVPEEKVVNPRWLMVCNACQNEWGAHNPEAQYRCPRCNSINITGRNLEATDAHVQQLTDQQWDSINLEPQPDWNAALSSNEL